ncbi:hypothetical protein [Croceibacterium mercuriale]|uniref:hypothetical protein n=1 Tax=Croceibacterium mercuriale TaxID=1572751 RepID=UPI001269EB12|nr:hypothetical protein [Croceibacterium mercuriale]
MGDLISKLAAKRSENKHALEAASRAAEADVARTKRIENLWLLGVDVFTEILEETNSALQAANNEASIVAALGKNPIGATWLGNLIIYDPDEDARPEMLTGKVILTAKGKVIFILSRAGKHINRTMMDLDQVDAATWRAWIAEFLAAHLQQ